MARSREKEATGHSISLLVKFKAPARLLKALIGNLERAQEYMKNEGLDALVAFSTSNVFYLTGFHSMLAILSKTPSSFAVLPRGGEPWLVLPADEEGLYITGEYQNKR